MSVNEEKGILRQAAEVLRLNWRAQKLMWRIAKGKTILDYIGAFLSICEGYWNILFSARLLDEVLYRRDPMRLLAIVTGLVGGDALIYLLRKLISAADAGLEFSFDYRQKMVFGDKLMSLDYEALESEKVRTDFKRVERETFHERKNLWRLVSLPWLFADLASIGIALSIFVSLFFQLSRMRGWLMAGLAFSGFGIWLASFCAGHGEKIFEECQEKISENCVQRDGYMDFLGDYQRERNPDLWAGRPFDWETDGGASL